jgi:hypothetical protein
VTAEEDRRTTDPSITSAGGSNAQNVPPRTPGIEVEQHAQIGIYETTGSGCL